MVRRDRKPLQVEDMVNGVKFGCGIGNWENDPMITQAFGNRNRNENFLAVIAKAALAALVVFGSVLADRPARAAMGGGAAAAATTANAGVGACSSNSGKALYECVASVLDRMSNEISRGNIPETQRALQTAASQLRAAVTKVQALSAITQCRAVIAGVLRQASASGREGQGLSAIAGVLAQAARLIQSKG
jgi:hypothetical protein